MRGEPTVLGAINRLYAAALARDDWASVLGHVRDAFAGHHVILATHDFGSGQVPFVASTGIDERERARVLSEESWRLAYPYYGGIPIDAAFPRGAIAPDGEFVRSAFYNEILRPARGFHAVGALLRGPGRLMASINICRPEHAGAYDAPDAAAIQTMLPHVSMALEVRERISAAAGRADGLKHLLDGLAVAALVTDSSARLRFANARAEALIAAGDGLAMSAAGLAAATLPQTRALRTAIAGVAAANGDGAGPAAAIRLALPRPSLRPALRVTLMPAWRLDPDGFGASGGGVAILAMEPDAPLPIDKEALADAFHLTRREADVAMLLANGADLNAIAAALGLGLGTVRFHLKHVFQKTGATSQAALVALARGFAKLDVS